MRRLEGRADLAVAKPEHLTVVLSIPTLSAALATDRLQAVFYNFWVVFQPASL